MTSNKGIADTKILVTNLPFMGKTQRENIKNIVGLDDNGRATVIWREQNAINNNYDDWAANFNLTSSTQWLVSSKPLNIPSATTNITASPNFAFNKKGDAVAVWQETTTGTTITIQL